MESIIKKFISLFNTKKNNLKFKTIRAYSITNCGLVREANEDNFYTAGITPKTEILQNKSSESFTYEFEKRDCKCEFFAVFDGMGGMNAGEKASSLGLSEFEKIVENIGEISNINEIVSLIQNYTAETSKFIYDMSLKHDECRGMGTTFVVLCIYEDRAIVLNAGDSRCYVYTDGALKQLSEDHTKAAESVRAGIITKEQEKHSSNKNKLTRFLGMPSEQVLMASAVSDTAFLEGKHRFILCSDGLYGQVEESEILKIVKVSDISKCANKLVDISIENGGFDNVTVTVVDILI